MGEMTKAGDAARAEHDNQRGSGGCDPNNLLDWDRIAQAAVQADPLGARVAELTFELEQLREVARRERGVRCSNCDQSKPGQYMRQQSSGAWLCVDHLDCQEHANVAAALAEIKRERDQLEDALIALREGVRKLVVPAESMVTLLDAQGYLGAGQYIRDAISECCAPSPRVLEVTDGVVEALQRECRVRAYSLNEMASSPTQRSHFLTMLETLNIAWVGLGHRAFAWLIIPPAEAPEYLEVVQKFAASVLTEVLRLYPLSHPPPSRR